MKKKSNKKSMALRIFIICLILQIIQSICPFFIVFQLFNMQYLHEYFTMPLFFTGIIMHMFSHGGWGHLLGNMSLGLPLMAYIEHKRGSKELLKIFVITGLAALFTQIVVVDGNGVVGASGALFGCLGYACLMFCTDRKSTVIGLAVLAMYIIPQLINLASGMMFLTNVAYSAHIGGCLAGIVLAYLHKK